MGLSMPKGVIIATNHVRVSDEYWYDRVVWFDPEEKRLIRVFDVRGERCRKKMRKYASRDIPDSAVDTVSYETHRCMAGSEDGRYVLVTYSHGAYLFDREGKLVGVEPGLSVFDYALRGSDLQRYFVRFGEATGHISRRMFGEHLFLIDHVSQIECHWPSFSGDYMVFLKGYGDWEEVALYDLRDLGLVLFDVDVSPLLLRIRSRTGYRGDLVGRVRVPLNREILAWRFLDAVEWDKWSPLYRDFRAGFYLDILLSGDPRVFFGCFYAFGGSMFYFAYDWVRGEFLSLNPDPLSPGWPIEIIKLAKSVVSNKLGIPEEFLDLGAGSSFCMFDIDRDNNIGVVAVVLDLKDSWGKYRALHEFGVVFWFDVVSGRLLHFDVLDGIGIGGVVCRGSVTLIDGGCRELGGGVVVVYDGFRRLGVVRTHSVLDGLARRYGFFEEKDFSEVGLPCVDPSGRFFVCVGWAGDFGPAFFVFSLGGELVDWGYFGLEGYFESFPCVWL